MITGQEWWVVKSVRHGVDHFDASGNLIRGPWGGPVFTLQNAVTGEKLLWTVNAQFNTNANGDVTVNFLTSKCRLQ